MTPVVTPQVKISKFFSGKAYNGLAATYGKFGGILLVNTLVIFENLYLELNSPCRPEFMLTVVAGY